MTVKELTPTERHALVGLLELAHGHALLGSIIPMRQARFELNLPAESKIFLLATQELKKQLGAIVDKPTADEYKDALGTLIDRILRESVP